MARLVSHSLRGAMEMNTTESFHGCGMGTSNAGRVSGNKRKTASIFGRLEKFERCPSSFPYREA